MIKKLGGLVLVVAFALPTMATAQGVLTRQLNDGSTFSCSTPNIQTEEFKEAFSDFGDNFLMMTLADIFTRTWEAKYMREQCQRFADGEPHDFSCIQGRHDWDAIKDEIPNDVAALSRADLGALVGALRQDEEHGAGAQRQAVEFCESVGAFN